jgi:hypothetical protein
MKGPDTEIDGSHNHYIKDGELTQVRREQGKVIGYRAKSGKWVDRSTASVPEPLEPIANAQEEMPFADPRQPKVRMSKDERKQLLVNKYVRALQERQSRSAESQIE